MAFVKLNVKKGDTVVVLSGKDKGKQGKVVTAMPKKGKVLAKLCSFARLAPKQRALLTKK